MEPTEKDEAVWEGLRKMFGFDPRGSIRKNVCAPTPIGCGQPVDKFKDSLSAKEFTISGLCQKCQDRVFGA